MKHIACMMAAALAATFSSQAAAADLGTSSSETMTITVIIPPIAPAIAAQQNGAVGVWTITGRENGLMLDLPSEISPGASEAFSLFAVNTGMLTVAAAGEGTSIMSTDASSDRGLGRQNFILTRQANAPVARSLSLVIGSL